MARIRFDISAALSKWRNRQPVSSRRFRMMDLQALHEMTLGPGWFDSSWDLDQGLKVEVALPGDPTFQAWLEAQARRLEPVAARAAQALPAEQMLEFEPVDWKSWAPPDVVVDPLPKCLPAGLEMPELALELAVVASEPVLELALV
jgi:hypothetical protein